MTMTKSEIIKELKELIDKLSHESTLLSKKVFLTYLADESTNPDERLYIEVNGVSGVAEYTVRWLREHVTFNPNHLSCWMQIQSYNKKWRAWTGTSIGDAPWTND